MHCHNCLIFLFFFMSGNRCFLLSSFSHPATLSCRAGAVPEWLTGVLYRNGCGLFEEGEDGSSHLFQGYAVVHRFSIQQGGVKYTSRVLDREAWMRAVKARRTAVGENGETGDYPDPCMTAFAGFVVSKHGT